MNALAGRIARLIAAQGPLTIAQFMTAVLYDPQAGAYAARDPIGRDFITAPEISQIFGELLGLWVVQAWHDQGRPARPLLVELGPGRGTLMADALRAISAAVPAFLDGGEVVLVEANPALEAIQREKLKTFDISWQTRFEAGGRPLYLIANEFFDCLPIHQFVKTENGWRERMVTVVDGALAFALTPVPADHLIPQDRKDAPIGGVSEIAPAAAALVENIARAIAAQGGAALLVDYGYDAPGYGETLQALAAGEFAPVLECDGDLSAHVDFAALAAAARAGGAAVYGSIGQGNLLTSLGIGPRAGKLMTANPEAARAIASAVERLVHPDKMGTLFKALAIACRDAPAPPGF
jgi:NADH dehydrogenase [ubiquinone] 1 alpha subcomplex assembly factor 7